MATHNETGKKGEALAIEWLKEKGYTILECNWRFSHLEIDIIAHKDSVLQLFEVKTRSQTRFGWPEESIDVKKLKRFMKAGAAYSSWHPQWKAIQYNIISINLYNHKAPEVVLIEDVYWMKG